MATTSISKLQKVIWRDMIGPPSDLDQYSVHPIMTIAQGVTLCWMCRVRGPDGKVRNRPRLPYVEYARRAACVQKSGAQCTDDKAAVPNWASKNAFNRFCAFSKVASIRMSRSKVARGTPYSTAAIPPMTTYLRYAGVRTRIRSVSS